MTQLGARGPALGRALLGAYVLFVVYGSLFPFQFALDPDEIRADVQRFLANPLGVRGRRPSVPDLAGNALVGAGFGVLLVATHPAPRAALESVRLTPRLLPAVARAAGWAVLLAAAVEAGQLAVPGRTPSLLDVVLQVLGAAAGGGLVSLSLRLGASGRRAAVLLDHPLLGHRPGLVLAGAVVALLTLDALYPYALSLDVSTVRAALRRAQLVPLGTFGRDFWGDVIVYRVLLWAAAAGALSLALSLPPARASSAGRVTLVLASTAAGLEAAKLLIVGRAPNVDGPLLAGVGAFGGALAVHPLWRWAARGGRRVWALPALPAMLLTYHELAPFRFVTSAEAVAARLRAVEWVPLAAYLRADLPGVVLDASTKLLIAGLLGGALGAAGWRRPVAWAGFLGAGLEAAQTLTVGRIPSVTDVGLIVAGAWLALVAWARPAGGSPAGAGVSNPSH